MIGRWAISCSLAAAAWCATVSGRVELAGSMAAGKGPGGSSSVVVWLEPVAGPAPATPPQSVSMAHHNKTFVPHLLAIRTGSKVVFPNQDPFFHNAFSNYEGQPFDIGLHPPGSTREVTFRRPGIVRLFCDIHPSMSAVIVVLDTPWFAATDPRGGFRIDNVPAGEYRLELFDERALPEVLAKLRRQIAVEQDDLTLPALTISEAGYLAPPHKNKYGKDYPPRTVDRYPGRK